jgi:hypothetical protein
MDTLSAYIRNRAAGACELMVFDWEKAARLIVERKAKHASAGLADDWEWTGGEIFANGAPVPHEDTYVFLSSSWATPEIEIDGQREDCFRMRGATPGWDSDTYWPPEAIAILNARDV